MITSSDARPGAIARCFPLGGPVCKDLCQIAAGGGHARDERLPLRLDLYELQKESLE